jgi:lipoate-protein ligase A
MEFVQRLTTEAGLQAEQDLLAAVCAGERPHGLLFWQPTDHALVMPRRMNRLANFDIACAELAASGWPVLLRETGGEPVPQSAATVNVALVYIAPRSEGDQNRLELAYQRLCDPLCKALAAYGGEPSLGEVEGAFCDGRYNVNLDHRKWVGTAQRWRQSHELPGHGRRPVVLVHGAMLMDDQRAAMVGAVNRFNQQCSIAQRCRADSHIAVHERFAALDLFERLSNDYGRTLDEVAAKN